MGVYLNPGSGRFEMAVSSQIYVDKSKLIGYLNRVAGTEQRFVCVSRPRRFGKSMAANMMSAYYQHGMDSHELFAGLEIAEDATFEKHINQYNVIFVNMQSFLSECRDILEMKKSVEKAILWDLLEEYPDFRYYDTSNLPRTLMDVYKNTKIPFVFIIDEWDCIFRENRNNLDSQKFYLDFLRNLLKDAEYVTLAYMTGILPIKKYGTHSALNMFSEFSMTSPRQMAEYVGFTEREVKKLCSDYDMDFEETRRWYDGYQFEKSVHIYSPKSVVEAMLSHTFGNYWTQTETYEALKVYIEMNFDGLKSAVTELLAGARIKVNTERFANDMTTLENKDDVLTLLIHLGYLAYDVAAEEVFIPNSEISREYVNAMEVSGWDMVIQAVKDSENLLYATWQMDEKAVAAGVEKAHYETSILTYNNEAALSYTLSLAYYSACVYYKIVREMPAGKGFADLVFLPRKNHQDKPAMILELKWNKSACGAISQIKDKNYVEALKDYAGNILLVGINYQKEKKVHECKIETYGRMDHVDEICDRCTPTGD